jgi:hypothetical protein
MDTAGSNQITTILSYNFLNMKRKVDMGRTNNIKENELYQNMR